MTRTLRKYQIEAVEAVRAQWTAGKNRTAIILPTGVGKTDCIAKIATDAAGAGRRVLAIAHRSELLDQITERCLMHRADIPVGRVQASRNQARRPITVAMAPTLASEKRRARLLRPDLVIVDEAHHAASPSQMAILQWAGSFNQTPTMGVTATMARGDKRGLGDVWSSIAYEKSIKWAIDEGWLVAPKGRAVVVDHMDLEHAKIRKGDYVDSELGELVSQDTDQIVKAWQAHASDRITVAFTPNVQSALDLRDEFNDAGVTAEVVLGSTPHPERKAIYARLAAGEIRVMVNVMVASEGWDCPPASCILVARPTRSAALYQQMVGRVLRPFPGKDSALVLDVVGVSRIQKLATLCDLHESAEYDTSELDDLPCDECMSAPCECQSEPTERDPDGGRRRLIGPAQFEQVDLFATSKLNWLFTHGGIRFLPVGDRMALLWPDGELHIAGHRTTRGYDNGIYVGPDGHWDPEGPLPLHEARQRAEEWALAVDPSISSKTSSWRRGGPASDKQVAMALRCGVENPETMNKARLSDEISIALASKVLDR